ncbi:helix-turn-helix transcriptional regulator [Clostridium sp. C2-6-12]|uniref:helix-turn-helix domain-containing protein n=1 Tax=Clostridium sp. C2-6-12 TaxID=2698832 RepID=UPI00136AF50D|nr:helix-turn-helix transcriptional regulator [Clostridium sp. C2-6-12]
MFNNEIMMQGEKLKKIRQIMLGATQSEISQGVCTKNMISQIEKNKKKLNFNLATGIAENLNKIAKNKGIDISLITPEELMIDDDEQANSIFANSIISEIKEIKVINLFDQKLLEAEELMEKYNIIDSNKIELYKLAANFYYYKHSFSKSDQMCDIGLKISINSQKSFDEINFYIYKSRNNIFTDNYIKALQQLDYAEKLNNLIMEDELSVMILHFRALTYKKLGEYDTALKYFKLLKQFQINDYKMLLSIKMVYANCLNDYYKFDEAEKEYKETLNIAMKYDDNDFIAMTYRNLSELYFNKKKYKDAAKYIKASLKNNPKNQYWGENLYFASKVLQHVNEDVETYLLQALEICEKNEKEDLKLIEQVIYNLVLIYIKKEDKENLMIMAHKAKNLNIDYSLIYLEIGEYYRGRNEEKSKYFTRKSKEKMKQIKKI